MALTRKMLKAMGIEDDKIDEIIDAHTETVDGLKKERDDLKKNAEKFADVERELNEAKKALEKNGKGETVSKETYDALKKELNDFREEVGAEKTLRSKQTAIRELAKTLGISSKGLDKVVKYTDFSKIELDENGKIKDENKHTEDIKSEWAEYVETTYTKGANTADPPANKGKGTKTKEEIYKMENGRYVLSASERQAELAKLYQSEKGD